MVQEGALVEEVVPSGEGRGNGAMALSGRFGADEAEGGADDEGGGGLPEGRLLPGELAGGAGAGSQGPG